MTVVDVSSKNDWSVVKVASAGDTLGRPYPDRRLYLASSGQELSLRVRCRPLTAAPAIGQTAAMVPLEKLAQITQRFEFLEAKLNAGASPAEIATLSREYSDLKPVADEIVAYRRALDDLAEAEIMLADPEMKALGGR